MKQVSFTDAEYAGKREQTRCKRLLIDEFDRSAGVPKNRIREGSDGGLGLSFRSE